VLDLGSGNGRHTIEACRWPVRVVSVDVDRDELQRARYYLRAPDGANPYGEYNRQFKPGVAGWADFILADAQHLPFKDGAFDKVLCTEVLEHIPDDRAGIRELHRVAKPGSDVAVSVPNYWPERAFWTLSWEYWHTPGGHVRVYKPGQMARYLQELGFEMRAIRRRHAFQSLYWFIRCTFGKDNDRNLLTHNMFRFVNFYHNSRLPILERIEAVVNLVLGKDQVHYTRKPGRKIERETAAAGQVGRGDGAG